MTLGGLKTINYPLIILIIALVIIYKNIFRNFMRLTFAV